MPYHVVSPSPIWEDGNAGAPVVELRHHHDIALQTRREAMEHDEFSQPALPGLNSQPLDSSLRHLIGSSVVAVDISLTCSACLRGVVEDQGAVAGHGAPESVQEKQHRQATRGTGKAGHILTVT